MDGDTRRKTPVSYYDNYTTTHGTQDLKGLFGEVVMDFPKPVGLVQDLLVWMTGTHPNQQDIVLDFFAGSGTTGEAVIRLNQADGGDRRVILVQTSDPTPPQSAAARAGFATIAELCRERLRRVLQEISSESTTTTKTSDSRNLGFQMIRLVQSSAD